jgi:hypothetical protein
LNYVLGYRAGEEDAVREVSLSAGAFEGGRGFVPRADRASDVLSSRVRIFSFRWMALRALVTARKISRRNTIKLHSKATIAAMNRSAMNFERSTRRNASTKAIAINKPTNRAQTTERAIAR